MDLPVIIVLMTMVGLVFMGVYVLTMKHKSIMTYLIAFSILQIIIWDFAVIMAGFSENLQMVLFWDNLTYLGSSFVAVSLAFIAIAFGSNGTGLTKKHFLLYIIPVLTQIILWTNDYHHLFYVYFNPLTRELIPGLYFYVHAIYSYLTMFYGFLALSYYAVRNSGIFSVQTVLIMIGSFIPAVVNVCYTLGVPGFNLYSTPTAFGMLLIFYILGIMRYDLLKISPIAVQTVMNRISDSFLVCDYKYNILVYNQTFSDNFNYIGPLRSGENLIKILENSKATFLDARFLTDNIDKAISERTIIIKDVQIEMGGGVKYFNIEFTPIVQRNTCNTVILLFKDVTQHILDLEEIRNNQAILLERARLASLGQLIGGIAHNLKTPIMSVSGGIDQIKYLVDEYKNSIGDSEVTDEDHLEIAFEMNQWLDKMKSHMSYMSDIISTVKDQASKFNTRATSWFTLDEMLKRVKILMQHELVRSNCTLVREILVSPATRIGGDINSLVQILDNIIVNSIQAYDGKSGKITLTVTGDEKNLLFCVSDNGKGISPTVKDRLFKEMITTKGKHGTGLGLYMSYSTIKGVFRGDMWYDSEPGKGTRFYVQLPVYNEQIIEEQ